MIPGLSRPLLVAAVLVGLPVWCSGCGVGRHVAEAPSSPALHRFEYRRVVMGVQARIVLEAPSEEAAFDAASAAFDRLAELNSCLSDYQQGSEINRLCGATVRVPQHVSDDLWTMLEAAKEVHRASGGAFDITVGHATRLWRAPRASGQPGDPAALAHARARIDMHGITLDPSTRSVTLTRSDLALDLGGIAKGYAAQQAVKTLRERGIARCLVALAGDIALGDAPSGETGWRIAIETDNDANADQEIVLANVCVSTSGSSQQSVEIAGVRYSHMLDPRTGIGTKHTIAATVIGPDGARTDALATALCVMDPSQRTELIAAYPQYRFVIHDTALVPRSSR